MSDELTADLESLRIDRERDTPPRKWPKRLLWLAVLAAIVIAAGVFGLPLLSAKVFRTAVEVTEVGLVSPARASTELTATGYVVPQRTSKVGAKIVGRLVDVPVKEGDRVEKGQVIARLEAADRRSAVATAKARVAAAWAKVHSERARLLEAKLKADRQTRLVGRGVAPKASAEDLQARVAALSAMVKAAQAEARAAQAEVHSREVDLGYTEVTAPMAGTIVNKPAAVGELVSLESSILELADMASILVEADVTEGRLGRVRPKGPCEIILDAFPGRRYRAEVVRISPRLDWAKATATVKVRFVDPPQGVRPEMAARVNFLSEALDAKAIKEPPRVVIPEAAITSRAGATVVFVVDGERVRMRPLEVGHKAVGGRVVLSGPRAGTRVVKSPSAELADGQRIKEQSN